ncbi:MAG: hypothetical protein EB829_06570 [Nitrosopumilus sp. H8]|nr:MAG: hypothetical protein EB830_05755 [Nitrosopumilus sp. H13]RNJ77524.1 MAG: hypothetical protein EB829_06570 [Nitrosopumilus sp. H8]
MMRARLTYVPVDVAEQYGDFIITKNEEVLGAVKAKTRDYSVLSLVKMLYVLRDGEMTFSEFYTRSKIRMKRSFLNYLHLCVDYGFVKKTPLGVHVNYSITDKGRKMLELLHKDN